MRIKVTEMKWTSIPSSEYILSLSDDPFWPFVTTIKAESGRRFELSLIDVRGYDVRKRDSSSPTIMVNTFDMTPVRVTCNIGLLPSSIYSYDGTLQITMTGGQPPYFILWADLAEAVYFNNTPQYTNTSTLTHAHKLALESTTPPSSTRCFNWLMLLVSPLVLSPSTQILTQPCASLSSTPLFHQVAILRLVRW